MIQKLLILNISQTAKNRIKGSIADFPSSTTLYSWVKCGVIEICVLSFIKEEDRYGYQIVQELDEKFKLKESTIYPILKRLHKYELVNTYLKESDSGPARKYYKLTDKGEEKLEELLNG